MSYESWRISYQSSEAAARAAYATTEKLHAELTALRDQLAAVGAGGVEPLRKQAATTYPTVGVPAQAAPGMTAKRASYFMHRFLKEEKLLGPNEQAAMHYVINLLAATPAADAPMVDMTPPATSRDRWMYEQGRLAERDARTHGSVAAAALDAERWMGIGKAIERACMDLPGGTEIIVSLEKDAGTVTLIDQDGNEHENFSTDYGFAGVMNEAIDTALADQAKQEVQL